jgi:hypothetical protein
MRDAARSGLSIGGFTLLDHYRGKVWKEHREYLNGLVGYNSFQKHTQKPSFPL